MSVIQVPGLLSFTIAILVFFAGANLNRFIPMLARWSIPEAVTGGLLAALATLAAYEFFSVEISFTLAARDMLLLYFFTGVGLNARLSDLVAGGKPLLILLAITLVFLVIQNAIAIGASNLLGLPPGMAILLGSTSLIGGHGTTIAWAPIISNRFGLTSALEVGIASATLGLVIASLIGGPIAQYLITRYRLSGSKDEELTIGVSRTAASTHDDEVSYISLLRTLLVTNIAILIGYTLHEIILDAGINLPLFVVCLLVAIVMTNTIPSIAPNLPWPTRSRALSLISDLSLNVFLAMSLMSMQLWGLGGLGLALVIVLAIQTIAAIAYILFVVFPAMGRNYEAAVISAGFCGISLGATPTAIANMTAVTKIHGAATIAFIILPLVSAFFIDLANAAALGFLVR
ncbi:MULTISPECIES: sodium/glutamate symporter [unclassified Rhizobium]|uniref:sodium/glutamate symporter n=1 Tax=unclassified Rhizobium TaxID=2613769 RepID=UPI001618ECB9|nr:MULTISPECIES: sodium/glutamate symporter [unclassified Rhizobium]MBB3541415.1 ESS family glutamate:Na+ symporter [Rhizobium sp. BK399]MCS3740139.1 ESS family glutamate:Na+ symporter [Rhizobium sp. BK661]MCS4091911.1 ESS family glutamate:Na+ symporter [Rhizobium sp. BK176]